MWAAVDPDTLSARLRRVVRRDGPGATRNPSGGHVPGKVIDSVLDVYCSAAVGIAAAAAASKGSLIIDTEDARHVFLVLEVGGGGELQKLAVWVFSFVWRVF